MVAKESQSAGGVVINDEGKILVVNQHDRSWSLPKGHIDPGEDVLAAARREIYEESGISELQFVRPLGTYQRYKIGLDGGDDASELKAITMFLFRTSQKSLQPADPDNPEARWVAQQDVAELLTHPKDRAFFESLKL